MLSGCDRSYVKEQLIRQQGLGACDRPQETQEKTSTCKQHKCSIKGLLLLLLFFYMTGSLEVFFFHSCSWEGDPWDSWQSLVELWEGDGFLQELLSHVYIDVYIQINSKD